LIAALLLLLLLLQLSQQRLTGSSALLLLLLCCFTRRWPWRCQQTQQVPPAALCRHRYPQDVANPDSGHHQSQVPVMHHFRSSSAASFGSSNSSSINCSFRCIRSFLQLPVGVHILRWQSQARLDLHKPTSIFLNEVLNEP
jgi:hypothetical protein